MARKKSALASISVTAPVFLATSIFLFPLTRKDKEKQMTFKLCSPTLQWKVIMPKLSYQRLNVDRNISTFYQRKNNQLSLEIEKRF